MISFPQLLNYESEMALEYELQISYRPSEASDNLEARLHATSWGALCYIPKHIRCCLSHNGYSHICMYSKSVIHYILAQGPMRLEFP